MIYLLDANTCIGWLRQNQPQIVARIQAEAQTDIVLCSVVVAELLFGVERSDPVHRANNGVRVDQLRAQFTSLPFDDAAAEQYGRIRADLTGRGLLIGGNDMLIAAIALANFCTLVTHNTAEFGRVAGLMIEDWQIP
ncbi:MAG: type II toxin-antitoxin system VapC family toxin [Planctomycetaceae bacterium]